MGNSDSKYAASPCRALEVDEEFATVLAEGCARMAVEHMTRPAVDRGNSGRQSHSCNIEEDLGPVLLAGCALMAVGRMTQPTKREDVITRGHPSAVAAAPQELPIVIKRRSGLSSVPQLQQGPVGPFRKYITVCLMVLLMLYLLLVSVMLFARFLVGVLVLKWMWSYFKSP